MYFIVNPLNLIFDTPGYLSFNRVASRELISACRSTAGLYEAFTDNNGEDGKISSEFIAEYRRQCAVGLPIAKTITTVIRGNNIIFKYLIGFYILC